VTYASRRRRKITDCSDLNAQAKGLTNVTSVPKLANDSPLERGRTRCGPPKEQTAISISAGVDAVNLSGKANSGGSTGRRQSCFRFGI
jgi:hypothetical protein